LRRNDPHTKKRQGQFPAASVPGAPHFSGSSHFFWPMPFFLANAVLPATGEPVAGKMDRGFG
jgi:hypothetical protein